MYVKPYRRSLEQSMRRTKAEAEQTREALLAAAIQVFLERGVARATLDEIARAAGVTRGALYWHFRDKLEIFIALEERALLPNEAVAAALAARLKADPGLDPIDELATTMASTLQQLEGDGERRRILTILLLRCEFVDEMALALHRQQRADAALCKQFGAIFQIAANCGRLTSAWSPEMAARALFLLLKGMIESWLRVPSEILLVSETMPLVTAFLGSVSLSIPVARRRSASAIR
jgi:AcrR family transcriptional regulator